MNIVGAEDAGRRHPFMGAGDKNAVGRSLRSRKIRRRKPEYEGPKYFSSILSKIIF